MQKYRYLGTHPQGDKTKRWSFLGRSPGRSIELGIGAWDRDSEDSKLRSHPVRRRQKGFSFVEARR